MDPNINSLLPLHHSYVVAHSHRPAARGSLFPAGDNAEDAFLAAVYRSSARTSGGNDEERHGLSRGL